jgi:hypothetical protein
MAPCNCGGGKSSNRTWVFTSSDGKTVQEYSTEVQARARVIREGSGSVTVKGR